MHSYLAKFQQPQELVCGQVRRECRSGWPLADQQSRACPPCRSLRKSLVPRSYSFGAKRWARATHKFLATDWGNLWKVPSLQRAGRVQWCWNFSHHSKYACPQEQPRHWQRSLDRYVRLPKILPFDVPATRRHTRGTSQQHILQVLAAKGRLGNPPIARASLWRLLLFRLLQSNWKADSLWNHTNTPDPVSQGGRSSTQEVNMEVAWESCSLHQGDWHVYDSATANGVERIHDCGPGYPRRRASAFLVARGPNYSSSCDLAS